MSTVWRDRFIGWFDYYAARTAERLQGLTDTEYLWEPVSACWSIRPGPSGYVVDGSHPEPDPPPVTTIVWRMLHVSSSLQEHWLRAVAFERGRAELHLPTEVPETAAGVIVMFTCACERWRADIGTLDDVLARRAARDPRPDPWPTRTSRRSSSTSTTS